ncbi:TolB-like translocation protein [Urbifossiella limnaea]|uniref:Hydrazine synthase alpha subunit middle domain-containing protein n=1 Tax=Urbifossiella limnaea TaxID=2528023 RepID=A0A517XTS7_9BACT|nr:hypothetical protein [Urbifossiella limnaea]QDU20903.1 hypothetical protein ETAA1_28660 [Urbifossiella limnaea]
MTRRTRPTLVTALAVAAGVVAYWFLLRPDPGDPRLNGFVAARPPVAVVFTSRSEPASFEAAAPDGEEFRYPGRRLWAAREGRLRLLSTRGTVHELTWGRALPDGGTLIDVMSPSVTLDGRSILFAGRKGGDDPGHFRLYEVQLDGSDLRPLTGQPGDLGAVAVPPLRFAADGSPLSDAQRCRIDYDDVDPVEVRAEPRQIVFASSRDPDLGRDHDRRSTQLWVRDERGRLTQATANRNNDRWPWPMASGYVAFSLWSRNREVVSADATDVRPFDPAVPSATPPTDAWLGAFVRLSSSGHFGMLAKPPVPVWRPRLLANGRVAFMTPGPDGRLTVAQVVPGTIAAVPSAAAAPLPTLSGVRLHRIPEAGRAMSLATPSPCPPAGVLLSAAGGSAPGAFGLYLAPEEWPEDGATAGPVELKLLFDDPDLVDAEPVAVYRRSVYEVPAASNDNSAPDRTLQLLSGKKYVGPTGNLFATGLTGMQMADLPGQRTDTGSGPVFAAPPAGAIVKLKVWASRRDRFDDPVRPRVPGAWEPLVEYPAGDTAGGPVPTDAPTVLAGFGRDGKVVRWESAAADAAGRRAAFYAFAGDHYSLATSGGRHFCVGCHPGHSGMPPADHRKHAEQFPH